MVFLGVSVLLVSLSFLVYYKHPYRSWPMLCSGLLGSLRPLGWKVDDNEPPEIRVGGGQDEKNSKEAEERSKKGIAQPVEKEKESLQKELMPPPAPRLSAPSTLPTSGRLSQATPNGAAPRAVAPGDSPSKKGHGPHGTAQSTPQWTPASSQHLSPPSRGPPKLKPLSPATASRPSAASSMLPPPRPSPRDNRIPNPSPSPLRVPASSSSTLPPPSRPRQKVLLSPGHSPLDWAHLQRNPSINLRNLPHDRLLRVSPSQLRAHDGSQRRRRPVPSTSPNLQANDSTNDAWTVLTNPSAAGGAGGAIPKVYNITPYLPFHPGGEPELLRAAGRDGTKLFMEIHPWVNWEGMLDGCLIGVLVGEGEGEGEGESRGTSSSASGTGEGRGDGSAGTKRGGDGGIEWEEVD